MVQLVHSTQLVQFKLVYIMCLVCLVGSICLVGSVCLVYPVGSVGSVYLVYPVGSVGSVYPFSTVYPFTLPSQSTQSVNSLYP